MKGILTKAVVFLTLGGVMVAPVSASAQRYHHRQQTKNQWRNLAYGSAALGALGFLTKNGTLGWLGAAGAGYSAYRYEQDRKSQSRMRSSAYLHSHYSLRRRHKHH